MEGAQSKRQRFPFGLTGTTEKKMAGYRQVKQYSRKQYLPSSLLGFGAQEKGKMALLTRMTEKEVSKGIVV